MAARPPLKQRWIEYEADIRCPRVNGRRNGLKRARLDLLHEWAAMSAANRTLCGRTLRDALDASATYPALVDAANQARQTAITMRALPNANDLSVKYFEECRTALGLAAQCRDACRKADGHWSALRGVYVLIPTANRTAGQVASINAATDRINTVQNQTTNWNGRLATINAWLNSDPIYANPGPGPTLKVREDHVPEERRPLANTTFRRDFGAEGVPGEWRSVGAATLAGGNSAPRVWFRRDVNGRIIDRLVRKEQAVPDLYDSRIMKGVLPWELECHKIANDVEDADGDRLGSFARLKTTQRDNLARWVKRLDREKSYCVYMDWYPGGNLNTLIANHRALPLNATTPSTPIPEPMIWNIAESLIRSGRRMGPGDAAGEGQQILHRDLKPANVFLGPAHSTHYSEYPQVYLSDFGHATMTSRSDERNPDWYSGLGGTNGFRAPEMLRFVHPTTLQPVEANPLLEHTNVWQVGAILRCLVLLISAPEQSSFLDPANDRTYVVNVPGSRAAATYSDDLLAMIDGMMRYEWDQRPGFDDLTTWIDDPDLPDLSQGMRDGTTPAALRATLLLAIPVPADAYALGMAAPA